MLFTTLREEGNARSIQKVLPYCHIAICGVPSVLYLWPQLWVSRVYGPVCTIYVAPAVGEPCVILGSPPPPTHSEALPDERAGVKINQTLLTATLGFFKLQLVKKGDRGKEYQVS